MRIDGNFSPLPMDTKASSQFEPGDIVRGRVIISENNHIQIETSQGIRLNARLSDGVQLETGSNVKLLIGEKIDGETTAKLLEHTDVSNPGASKNQSVKQDVEDAFRDIGVKAVPQLIESAMKLIREKNMDSKQAAFVTANEFGNDAKSIQMLQRIVDGQFGFSENWNKLAGVIGDAVTNMSDVSRNAVTQPLVLSELLDTIVSSMNPANTAVSNALKDVFMQWSQQMPSSENALAQLQESMSTVTGGKAFMTGFFAETSMNMNITSLTEAIQALQNAISNTGTTASQLNGNQQSLQANAGQTRIQSNIVQQNESINLQINNGQNNANQQIPVNSNSTASTQPSLSTMETATAFNSVNQQITANQQGSPGLQSGESQLDRGISQSQVSLQMNANTLNQQNAQTAENSQSSTSLQSPVNIPGTSVPQEIFHSQSIMNMNALLDQLSNAVELARANTNLNPDEAKALISKAFDGAVIKMTSGESSATPLPDIAKMTQIVKEQLEWSSRVLSQTDASSAAVLRPMIEDAVGAMRLFQQITTYQTFVQVPIQLNDQHAQGELYVMKRKGNRGKIDASDFTLFLSLDTENLGHLESLAHAKNKQVSLHFQVDNTDIQNLLRETRQTLYEGLKKKGFSLVDMKVRIQEEQITPLNAFVQAEKRLGRADGFDVKI